MQIYSYTSCHLQKLQSDIDSHRTSIDAVTKSASKLLQTSEPSVARAIQNKLDSLNSCYERLISPVQDGCQFTQNLSDQLRRLEEEVDDFEDWLLPALMTLQAPDFQRMDLADQTVELEVTSIA